MPKMTEKSSTKPALAGAPVEGCPEGWRLCYSARKKHSYYFNIETGESSWEKPIPEVANQDAASPSREGSEKSENVPVFKSPDMPLPNPSPATGQKVHTVQGKRKTDDFSPPTSMSAMVKKPKQQKCDDLKVEAVKKKLNTNAMKDLASVNRILSIAKSKVRAGKSPKKIQINIKPQAIANKNQSETPENSKSSKSKVCNLPLDQLSKPVAVLEKPQKLSKPVAVLGKPQKNRTEVVKPARAPIRVSSPSLDFQEKPSVTSLSSTSARAAISSLNVFPINTTDAESQIKGEDMDFEEQDSNYEAMMIDIEEFRQKNKMDVLAVSGALTGHMLNTSLNSDKNTKPQPVFLYVIVDTNILISYPGFIDELKDRYFPGLGYPHLVIPWMVLQELDAMKENRRKDRNNPDIQLNLITQTKAQLAVVFLNRCLESGHPRVKGQTPQQASKRVSNFTAESNDDRILHCCLQYAEECPTSEIVLLTLDRNLRNKSLVLGIASFTKEGLLTWLSKKSEGVKDIRNIPRLLEKDSTSLQVSCGGQSSVVTMSQARTSVPTGDTRICISSCDTQTGVTPHEPERVTASGISPKDSQKQQFQLADDALCKVKECLKKPLEVVLETEMKTIYGDLWKEIVFRKPPWTLQDLIVSFEKHWIAVFGLILPRDNQVLLESIREVVTPGKGYGKTIREVTTVTQAAITLLEAFYSHSCYDGTIKKALAALNTVQGKMKAVEATVTVCELPSTSNVQAIQLDTPATLQNGPSNEATSHTNDIVQQVFQTTWEAIAYYCTTLHTELQATSHMSCVRDQRQAAVLAIAEFSAAVAAIRAAYLSMLSVSPSSASSGDAHFSSVCKSLHHFSQVVKIQLPYMEVQYLKMYFADTAHREILRTGFNQLEGMIQDLLDIKGQLSPAEVARVDAMCQSAGGRS